MAVRLPFTLPDEGNYIRVNVYEADDQCGTFSLVYSAPINNDSTYVDYPEGDPDKWYKLGFITDQGIESELTDAFQGTEAPEEPCNGRISARLGRTVCLPACFYRNGIPQDPYAIRMVRIYRRAVEEANLVAEIPFLDPGSTDYPLPAIANPNRTGCYELQFDVPSDWAAPDAYFDVWYFVPDDLGSGQDITDESTWLSQCNKFWVYPDGWFIDDGLIVPRLGFEPLDVKFRAGEKRYLEVGMMPLPLYAYDYNLVAPMLPYVLATITIETQNKETIVDNESMEIGLRQGTYRSNPFVIKYFLDTSRFIIGTYNYQVTLVMPQGQTIVSPRFTLTIS
ncbi:MAG: hypothetical protein GF411_08835 [Candidatus Lokiarchaeota archaeon]|nr:hypothetical protein [Candidatus Lokiarchaeota archaeon]